MNVIEAIHGRRSIRRYRADPLERQQIEDLIWAAAQAPTPPPSGARPWAFCVLEGRDRLAELGARAKAYAREHQPGEHAWPWAERADFEVFWGAPAAVLICARTGNAGAPFDCVRAGQNLLLAAHAWGLGACWVGAPLPWLKSPGVAAELGLPDGFDPAEVVILGRADERPAGQPRPRPEITWCAGLSSRKEST